MGGEHTRSPEVFPWLKTLPLAPEYHPTLQEFQDPIAYIFKIEKEASHYGICKIVPPLPPPSKKSVITNLNNSISLSQQNPNFPQPTFTTRQQQIGFCPRKHRRPIQKPVWQSGEHYTLQQFEAKAKNFEKNYLKNKTKKSLSPLEVETLYWKANGDRPFSVEYANDMPGSAFPPMREKKTGEMVSGGGAATTVGDTAWNMRGVARENGSLLRFMKEDIPGVTSPMVYVAMMFSWFAWHVEDHDLHSLNYLHFGAGKTWYGVPRDAAAAFEEVIRVHGFGEEINPLVTFATLGEKTAVMSPEVLIKAGVPCCRLVQNAGEFVVTFPRAYHCGFSHGFNCAEASNIATPEWLRFAKDAAIRRASINYPPMVSHFQLLYDLALAICSRVPMGNSAEPRSSRLKDKKKGEGETLVKQMFVQDVMQKNDLLYILGQGSEVVLLPHNSSEKFSWSNLRVGSKYKVKPGLPFSLYSSEEAIKASDDIMLARQPKGFYSSKGKCKSGLPSHCSKDTLPLGTQDSEAEKGGAAVGDGLSDRGLFSCVKCGIWTFACVAIVQPTESTAQYLMSADCTSFNGWIGGSGASSHGIDVIDGEANPSEPDSFSGSMEKNARDGLYDVPVQTANNQSRSMDNTSMVRSTTPETIKTSSNIENKEVQSALGLLAMTYGNSSDSDEEEVLPDVSEDDVSGDDSCGARFCHSDSPSPNSLKGYDSGAERGQCLGSSRSECEDEESLQRFDLHGQCLPRKANSDHSEYDSHDCSTKFMQDDTMTSEQIYSPNANEDDNAKSSDALDQVGKPNFPFARRCDEDSSRIHVFCLEHAVEVEKQLRPIGGVNILLLCHPDYPKVEVEAKKVAEELEIDYVWNDIAFSEATKEDEEWIQLALLSEEATPKNGDWAVKLGINLFYSAILSRSPLYNKQMPYNSVIYSAFGCNSPSKSPQEAKFCGKGFGRQKKLVVAGKWCGKVWMSNQVHPLLVQRDQFEEERTVTKACLKSDDKTGRKPESSNKAQTTPITYRKTARKRKSTAESKPAKKLKFEARELADSEPEDLVDDKPEFEPRRSVRKPKTQRKPIKTVKSREEENPGSGSEGSMSDNEPHLGPWVRSAGGLRTGAKPTQKRRAQQRVTENTFSDDAEEEKSSHHGRKTSSRKTKAELKPSRKVRTRLEILGGECEGSLDDEEEAQLEPLTSPWHVSKEFGPVSDDDDDEMEGGPSTRLRKRIPRPPPRERETKLPAKKQVMNLKGKKVPPTKIPPPTRKGPKMRLPKSRAPQEEEEEGEAEFCCDIEGCNMSFGSKQELVVHKRNVCPVKGCGKKFFSHKYLVQHRRVHMDDRPLKCPWKGCRMTFKWAWARTEHIRVHTGARPYVCNESGCGQTFRFVSDFSRHKRKTGHSAKKARK